MHFRKIMIFTLQNYLKNHYTSHSDEINYVGISNDFTIDRNSPILKKMFHFNILKSISKYVMTCF